MNSPVQINQLSDSTRMCLAELGISTDAHLDAMTVPVLNQLPEPSRLELIEAALQEMTIFKEGFGVVFEWLQESAQSDLPNVAHAARTLIDFYIGEGVCASLAAAKGKP